MGFTKDVITEGKGPTPSKGQMISVHCTGYVEIPGQPLKKFWSTKDPGQKIFDFNVGLGKVIRGWDEGMMTMKEGEKAKLHMSADYGYGEKGFQAWGIPPNAPLMFEVEIVKIGK